MTVAANETMTWNTFLAGEGRYCEASRHDDKEIPASTFEMLWFRDHGNITQSRVIHGWFTCSECHTEMWNGWLGQ